MEDKRYEYCKERRCRGVEDRALQGENMIEDRREFCKGKRFRRREKRESQGERVVEGQKRLKKIT